MNGKFLLSLIYSKLDVCSIFSLHLFSFDNALTSNTSRIGSNGEEFNFQPTNQRWAY